MSDHQNNILSLCFGQLSIIFAVSSPLHSTPTGIKFMSGVTVDSYLGHSNCPGVEILDLGAAFLEQEDSCRNVCTKHK